MEKNSLTKVSMNLSHKSLANINDLSALLRETNKTRVVSSSLQVAKEMLTHIDNGKTIITKDRQGNEQEIKFIF